MKIVQFVRFENDRLVFIEQGVRKISSLIVRSEVKTLSYGGKMCDMRLVTTASGSKYGWVVTGVNDETICIPTMGDKVVSTGDKALDITKRTVKAVGRIARATWVISKGAYQGACAACK